jgi:AraC-like DNA-binding protein
MATPLISSHAFDSGLLPSGTLWQPRASLAACIRATMARSTLGVSLSDEQRINHFPATPLCSLSWWFEGSSFQLLPGQAGTPCALTSPRVAMPGRWVLAGPQTRFGASWCPGPVHAMMVLFMPDALHLMTGLEPAVLTDRFVDATTVLPPEWLPMCQQVQDASDDAQRMALLEDFLEPRWQACRPALPLQGHRYADWAMHLAQRAATSGPGRSLRQLERRIKRWAGLPLRELRGMGRSEQAFFRGVQAQTEGTLHWAHIAADSGYADQSHLCRETRRITGFSPETLRDGIERHEGFWAYRLWM